MKNLIIILFTLIFGGQLSAKKNVYYVELQNKKFGIENADFYISRVIDKRRDTTFIGMAQVGAFNKQVVAKLKGGVETGFYNFISNSLATQDELQEVILAVTEFKISERTTMVREFGEALLKMDFYIINAEKQLVKVFQSESFISESTASSDVTKRHERRVRHVIVDGLKKFSASNWMEEFIGQTGTEEPHSLDSNTVEKKELPATFEPITLNPRNPRYSYIGTSYTSLIDLENLILGLADEELKGAYYKYKSSLNTTKVFGFIGGGLIGYPLGATLAGAELNIGVLLTGVGILIVGFIIESSSKKLAVTVIDLYNSKKKGT